MSLSYHSEHLAWQQRVNQERSRASTFYKTVGAFYSASPVASLPFPSANQDLVPSNYKSLNYNIGYTFGGTKPIRYATLESPSKKVKGLRDQVRDSREREIKTPEKKRKEKISNRHLVIYAKELKSKIQEEKIKRLNLERHLTQ